MSQKNNNLNDNITNVSEARPLMVCDNGRDMASTASPQAQRSRETIKAFPRRTVIVEPVMAIYVMCIFPMTLATQLYVYDAFLASVASEEGHNITSLPGESPGCAGNQTNLTEFLDRVQAKTSTFLGFLMAITGVSAFAVSMFLGPYSDKAGRKWALILPLAGAVLRATCYVFVVIFDLNVWWFLVGALLDGLGGFITTLKGGCSAYIADVTTPEKRIVRLTIIEMCGVISMLFTPVGLGYLIQQTGYIYAYVAVLCGFMACLIYVIFFVPETRHKDAEATFFTTSHIKELLNMYKAEIRKGKRWKLIILTSAFLFVTMVISTINIDTLFVKNKPLCWNSVLLGYYTAVFTGVSAAGAIILAATLKKCVSDHAIAIIAVIGAICLYLYKASVTSTIMMFCSSFFGMFGYLLSPTVRALLSKLVPATQQGRMFGALASVEMAGMVIGSLLFNLIYSVSLNAWIGLTYVTMAMTLMMAAILICVYLYGIRKSTSEEVHDEDMKSGPEAQENVSK